MELWELNGQPAGQNVAQRKLRKKKRKLRKKRKHHPNGTSSTNCPAFMNGKAGQSIMKQDISNWP